MIAGGGVAHEEPGGRRSGRVLVVDDEPDMLENVSRILHRSPYACVKAGSVMEAIGILDRDPPDLILTDLRMPGFDGLTVVREARRRLPGVPIILVTAYVTDSAVQEAIGAGAAGVLAKPFTGAELLGTVHQALEQTRPPPAPPASP